MGKVFFLDERLDLNHHDLTPKAQECITRLCSYMPFNEARKTLMDLTGTQVSESTTRRCMLETDETALEVYSQEIEQLQQKLPESTESAKRQVISGDGAMVP